MSDLIIQGSQLLGYAGSNPELVIPEGITEIPDYACMYHKNKTLTGVTLPKSVERIGQEAFGGCALTRFEIPAESPLKIGRIFGYVFPSGLKGQLDELSRRMDADAVKAYITADNWGLLSEDSKARIFLTCQDAKMKKFYKRILKPADCDPLSAALLSRLGEKISKKECGILAQFMLDYTAYLSGSCLKTLYDAIAKQKKAGADAKGLLDASAGLKKKLSAAAKAPETRGPRTKNDVAFDNMELDDSGVKVYDLGNKEIRAVLQPDLCILILDPKTGKTAKSVPKRGADPEKYAAAAEDFTAVQKGIKTLMQTCRDALYELYLSGGELTAALWQAEWTGNPITRTLASMVVWQQGESCFCPENGKPIAADGSAHALTDAPIRVAHTMDLTPAAVTDWQKFFNTRNRKQPFLQIWEPVRKREDIRPDRYAGCSIRNGYLYNRKTLGIDVYFMPDGWTTDFPGVFLTLPGFEVDVGAGKEEGEFEIKSIIPQTWNRRSNAILSFLDRITVYGRIHRDDDTVAEILDQFTLEQITDFLGMATRHSCVKVSAVLLEYKNTHFANFDPMDEFTLEF